MNNHATLKSYCIGFFLSILLTLAAYISVTHHLFETKTVILVIMACAIVQFIVQLRFFLHLGQRSSDSSEAEQGGWNVVIFFSTIGIVLILVVGTIWIMSHLNSSMSPDQMNQYMLKNEGMGK